MLSPVSQHHPNYAIRMMERLGIDPSAGVVPQLSLLYATASRRCESCPWKRACGDWLDWAPDSVSFAPPFCRNSDILAELRFKNLNTHY
jgi:hypothetical protein